MRIPKQNILFNLDDTLVECNKYFNEIINQFVEQMSEWFPTIEPVQFENVQLDIDLKAIDVHGLTSERFPESFVQAYEHFCRLTGREEKDSEKKLLRDLGFSVFEVPVEPLPYMRETLQILKDGGHELYLHTGGDEKNQKRKIAQLELTTYFEHRIFISNHKDSTVLKNIMKTMDFKPHNTWMVGNSLRTDILPSLEMGLHTIFIPAKSEWKYNEVEINIEPKGAYLILNELKEVPEAIFSYLQNNEVIRS